MGLNLNKRRPDGPRLGRGKVPKEIKKRVEEDFSGPGSEAASRGQAWTRRVLKTEGRQGLKRNLSERLREVGGEWEDPDSWKPNTNAQLRRKMEYEREIQLEEKRKCMLLRTSDDFRALEKLVDDLKALTQQSVGEVYSKQPGASPVVPPDRAPLGCEMERGYYILTLGRARVPFDPKDLGDTGEREKIARHLVENM